MLASWEAIDWEATDMLSSTASWCLGAQQKHVLQPCSQPSCWQSDVRRAAGKHHSRSCNKP